MVDARRRPPNAFKGLTMRIGEVTVPPPRSVDDAATLAFPAQDRNTPEEPLEGDEGIEVVVIREDATPRRARQTWRAYEVWTKNRVYGMDANLVCIEVVDRASGMSDPKHPILGGKLGGGRRPSGRGAAFSHPLPLKGMEAMFLRNKKQGFTSVVERVVVRLRVMRVRNSASWDEIVAAGYDDAT